MRREGVEGVDHHVFFFHVTGKATYSDSAAQGVASKHTAVARQQVALHPAGYTCRVCSDDSSALFGGQHRDHHRPKRRRAKMYTAASASASFGIPTCSATMEGTDYGRQTHRWCAVVGLRTLATCASRRARWCSRRLSFF